MSGWIGVDLDGTLAYYEKFVSPTTIGDPIPLMLLRVRKWLSEGKDVRIFTARANPNDPNAGEAYRAIEHWCLVHIGVKLPITYEKDLHMWELWDDRAVQVKKNTGERIDSADYIWCVGAAPDEVSEAVYDYKDS
jgi:hypothetical protein